MFEKCMANKIYIQLRNKIFYYNDFNKNLTFLSNFNIYISL